MRTSHELVDWQGYMTHAEVFAMQDIASLLLPNAIIVKIGAGAGTDTLAILEKRKDLVIFSIDIAAGEQPQFTNEHLRLEECGLDKTGNVIRIWGDSKIVGLKWPSTIDWLHIDGDHTEAGIKGDIVVWLRHVKIGGFVSFHDYNDPKWPMVKEVVDSYMAFQEHLHEYSVDKFAAFRKIE